METTLGSTSAATAATLPLARLDEPTAEDVWVSELAGLPAAFASVATSTAPVPAAPASSAAASAKATALRERFGPVSGACSVIVGTVHGLVAEPYGCGAVGGIEGAGLVSGVQDSVMGRACRRGLRRP